MPAQQPLRQALASEPPQPSRFPARPPQTLA